MDLRLQEIKKFLTSFHLNHSKIEWLKNDASGRRYGRLKKGKESFILMDSPLNEKPDLFYKIDKLLKKNQVNVPHLYKSNLKQGLILMEDLGETTLSKKLENNKEKFSLYIKVLDIIIKVLNNIKEKPDFIPHYSEAYLKFEENLFTDWYIPALTGKRLEQKSLNQFSKIWEKLNHKIQKMPQKLVLLDYHADNLMISSTQQMVALDFQDARWGGFLYDVISLLEDERHPLDKDTCGALWNYFWEKMPSFNTKKNQAFGAILAAQRHIKVIGIFARLAVRDNKPKYLDYIPDSWKMLEENLKSPELKSLKKWLDKYVKRTLRPQKLTPKYFPYLNTAMILAAGRGTRMKDLTDHCPKPLVKVNGKTLLSYVLNHARHIQNIVINTCYCGAMIHKELKGKDITFSDEKSALETGGGVQKALPYLMKTGSDGFFVLNADTLWLDKKVPLLKQMEAVWNPLKMDILLALIPTKKAKGDVPKGDYFIQKGHPVRRQMPLKKAPYCFMGVQILHPDIFKDHPMEKYSLYHLYDEAEKKGRLGYLIFDGEWFHVGTPEAVDFTSTYFKRKKV